MRIAYYSPAQLPEAMAYDRALLPHLSCHVELERFVEAGAAAEVAAAPLLPTFEEGMFSERHSAAPYDLALYAIGDDPAYRFAWEALQRRPGLIDLQSLGLHRLYGDRPPSGYEELLAEGYGEAGRAIGHYRALGFPTTADEALLPLGVAVAAHGLGASVHTAEASTFLQQRLPALPTAFIRRPLAPPLDLDLGDLPAIRQRLGLPPQGLVITSGGNLPLQRRERLARAYGRLLLEDAGAVLLIAAEDRIDASLWSELLRRERLLGAARIVDVGASTIARAEVVAVTDVGLYLRAPALGEMPELPLCFLAAGKATAVLPSGGLAEFPEDCCARVEPGPPEEELLWAYMRLLATQPELRQRMGENARDYVSRLHSPETVAREYQRFLEEVDRILEHRRICFLTPEPPAAVQAAGPPAASPEPEEPPTDTEEAGPVDVEQIMAQIRLRTGQRYLTDQPPLPTFSAYRPLPAIRSEEEREMLLSLGEANLAWELPEPAERTDLSAYLLELVRQQSRCNASLVRTLNRMTALIYDPAREVELTALRYEVAALYQRLAELEKRIEAARGEPLA